MFILGESAGNKYCVSTNGSEKMRYDRWIKSFFFYIFYSFHSKKKQEKKNNFPKMWYDPVSGNTTFVVVLVSVITGLMQIISRMWTFHLQMFSVTLCNGQSPSQCPNRV